VYLACDRYHIVFVYFYWRCHSGVTPGVTLGRP
jgi:hypothetical protein